MFEVNAIELQEALIEDLKVGLTPMVASSPGMGKSDIIRHIDKLFKISCLESYMIPRGGTSTPIKVGLVAWQEAQRIWII